MLFDASPRWLQFYNLYGVDASPTDVNDAGWVNFKCILPTHNKVDRGAHGSINIFTGNYRCWNSTCMEHASQQVNKRLDASILTPVEFLILVHNFTSEEALRTVSEFNYSTSATIEQINSFEERILAKSYPGELPGIVKLVQAAQQQLAPELDIVRHYITSRGIRFETLQKFDAGYQAHCETSEECIILPYYLQNKVVGIRGRTIDGRKGATKNSWLPLFHLKAIQQFPHARVCAIVEGETDCMLLQQILSDAGIDMPVFGTPGVRFSWEWSRYLQDYNSIYYIPQADRAAQSLVNDLLKAMPGKVQLLNLPWQSEQWGKDLADFVLQNGVEPVEKLFQGINTQYEVKRILTPADMVQYATQEIDWVIPELIERGTKTLIVGPPKAMKTFVVLQMMASLAQQTPFLGIDEWTPTTPGKSLLVEEEGSVVRLSQRVLTILQGDLTDNISILHRQGVQVDNNESLAKMRQDILDLTPDLLVVDPYAEIHSQDENTVQGAQTVIKAFNDLMRMNPKMALVVLHHTPKLGNGARGSSALFAAFDMMIEVRPVAGVPGAIVLHVVGRDVTGDAEDMTFQFNPSTYTHAPTTLGTLSKSAGVASAESTQSTVRQLHKLLRDNPNGVTMLMISNEVGLTSNASKAFLQPLIDLGKVVQAGTGKRGNPFVYKLVDRIEDE